MSLLFIVDGIILLFFEGILGDAGGSHGVVPDRDGVAWNLKETFRTVDIPVSCVCVGGGVDIGEKTAVKAQHSWLDDMLQFYDQPAVTLLYHMTIT